MTSSASRSDTINQSINQSTSPWGQTERLLEPQLGPEGPAQAYWTTTINRTSSSSSSSPLSPETVTPRSPDRTRRTCSSWTTVPAGGRDTRTSLLPSGLQVLVLTHAANFGQKRQRSGGQHGPVQTSSRSGSGLRASASDPRDRQTEAEQLQHKCCRIPE